MSERPISLRAYARLLRTNRNVRLLWIGQMVSQIGDWLYVVAIFDVLLASTGSARTVAFAFVLMVLPQVFAAPAAGVLNDRLSRRKMMLISDWARAAIVFAMIFAQTADRLWLLYLLLILETIFWALYEPARNAVIPNITCSKEEALVANGLSGLTWSVTLMLGSAIGGVLAATLGHNFVFVANSLTFVVSAFCAWGMRFHEPHLEHVEPMKLRDLADFRPLLEGASYVLRDRWLGATMLVKAGLGVLGTNWVVLPIMGERIFPMQLSLLSPRAGGMLAMSLLMGCRGIGAFLGPLASSRIVPNHDAGYRTAILASFGMAAAGYLALGQASELWIAGLAVALAHSGASIAWVYSSTLLQTHTDDRFRGRVFSAEFAMSMLTLSVVSYSAGVLVDEGVSIRMVATLTGAIVIVPAILWSLALQRWHPARSV
ncbi:MAG TPA: MFS transporter [Bryobacteraceae bacterium]|nr:MFS transporter [Bryobacteraceae bacterium]